MKSVLLITIGLALGHAFYQYFLTDIPSLDRVIELTWFQFNAIILYWWFTKA